MRLDDLLPPLVVRLVKKNEKSALIHPFDCVPPNLKTKWVVDIGANVGDIAVAALESYKDCNVVCFEPVLSTFKILEDRLKPYGTRVMLYRKALSDKNGEGEINITNLHGANSILPQAEFYRKFNPHIKEIGKETIELVRLDDLTKDFPTNFVDIMKIDVEGYEMNVLRGGRDFLASHADVLIVEASFMRDQSWNHQAIFDIFALLDECGFNLINVYDLNKTNDENMMLCQMDCVFRHRSMLDKRGLNARTNKQ